MKKSESITVRAFTPNVGAMIEGIDLRDTLSDDIIREIHAALMRYHVVFLRDQHITPQQHADFGGRFGPLRKGRRAAFDVHDDVPDLQVLINDRERPPNVNHYHTDGIFREAPEFASILHADIVPDAGGDTIFVSLVAAYEALSDGMKAHLDALSATNEFMKLHGSPAKTRSWEGDNFERMDAMRRDNPPVVHPLVKHHPITGKKHLYLSESFTTHILGVEAEESQRLLDFLFRHVAKPEFQCRFAWRPGSMAFWDNRAALHYAVADYWPETRRMNRITIETDQIGGI
ncbi:MAG: TauD/TfdA family dioxygenase [Alphaproteobacteria bacterium]|nr:TauD/TfdA family dioxygenase [Alphaproteobacteria bacterium]